MNGLVDCLWDLCTRFWDRCRSGAKLRGRSGAPAIGALQAIGATGAIGVAAFALPASAEEPLRRPHAVEPIVLMRDGNLEGCGLRAVYFTPKAKLDLEVVTLRAGGGTEFDVSVFMRDRYDRPTPIVNFELETRTLNTAERFPAVSGGQEGMLSTRMALDQFSGAQFIQGLMVSGGTLSVIAADGKTHLFGINGPVANLVRASYLNCSGDLYRPLPSAR